MERWYAVYTKPNCEYIVASRLAEHAGLEVYLPEIAVDDGTEAKQRRPFFPCYLFVRLDLRKVSASKWQWMRGLRYFVSFEGRPCAIPADVIRLMRRKLAEQNSDLTIPEVRFEKGDNVRIKEGPFCDMVAIFDGSRRSEERVRILLSMMGRYYRLKIPAANLEKVETASETGHSRRGRGTRGRGRRIKKE